MSSIVEAAGITKGALFHHFKNKKALFFEVWRELQTQMDAEARAAAKAASSSEDPYAAFLAGCKTYISWTMRKDYQQIVLLDGPIVLGLAGWYEADHELGQENVRAGIDHLVSKGKISPHRAESLCVLLQGALNGAGFAFGRNIPGITAESVLEAFESMLRRLE